MKDRGFGLVEVLIALLIIGIAVVGFSRLMLANIRSVSYDNTQQLTSNATQYIVDKINANLQLNDQNASAQNYVETNYNDDATIASALCNSGVYCTPLQQARSDLYQWKQYLSTLHIPQLQGTVCNDTPENYGIPTLSNPNCSGNGDVVVKLVWSYLPSASESILTSNTRYTMIKITDAKRTNIRTMVGDLRKIDDSNITNGSNLTIIGGRMLYIVSANSATSDVYSCDLSSQCTNSPLTIHSAINQLFTYNNNPIYTNVGSNAVYQCKNANCSTLLSSNPTGNNYISAVYSVANSGYVVTDKNVVYVNNKLNAENGTYTSYVDYNANSFQTGANFLPTATTNISSLVKIPTTATDDSLSVGDLYLGFNNGGVYLDQLSGSCIDGNNCSNVMHTITNTNSTSLMQNVVDLTTYTNDTSTYLIAANQNNVDTTIAGLYYLDTNHIRDGWHILCNGLANGNVNSVAVSGADAYLMVGGSSSGAGLYKCGLSGIGE